jgi:hypothetical protein
MKNHVQAAQSSGTMNYLAGTIKDKKRWGLAMISNLQLSSCPRCKPNRVVKKEGLTG